MKVAEITQKNTSCIGLGCASVFKTDHDTLIIVGKVPAIKDLPKDILQKLSEGEIPVEVPSTIFP